MCWSTRDEDKCILFFKICELTFVGQDAKHDTAYQPRRQHSYTKMRSRAHDSH